MPNPGFLSKTEAEWTEDEKKQFKEYDKKCKELNEEKDKYRKVRITNWESKSYLVNTKKKKTFILHVVCMLYSTPSGF